MIKNSIAQSTWQNPWHYIATGFGVGLMPKMPGTWGTVIGIGVYTVIHTSLYVYLAILVLLGIIAYKACAVTTRDLQIGDHPSIVIDEIIGYCVAMIGLPLSIEWMLLGFVLFRVFDIVKPYPIKFVDKSCKGPFGIIVDDILAGIYALICMQILFWYI